MTDTQLATAELPPRDHNQPPQTPFDTASDRIDLLHLEAANWFDGDPIENDGQHKAIKKLLADVRTARKDADTARKVENKEFDEGKAEVQGRYNPLLKKADTITDICKKVLAPWLVKVQVEIDAAAELARKDADEATAKSQEAFAKADPTNLEAREEAERYADDAKAAKAAANRAAKVTSGDKTVSLRSVFTGSIYNLTACAKHYWNTDRAAREELIREMVRRDVRAGTRDIPGVEITEERVAQ